MRKLILTVVSIIMVILTILCVTKGVNGPFSIYSYSQIQQKNDDTTAKLNELTNLKSNDYRKKESELKKSVTEYQEVSAKYATVSETKTDIEKIAALSGNDYDIEFLQIKLGKYATENKIDLSIELSKNEEKDGIVLCDFKFQVVGSYSGIINFIEDISSDEQLKFIPENLKMHSEYREVSTIYEKIPSDVDDSLQPTNKVNKKQKRLMLVGEFYKSNISIKKDSLSKTEASNETTKE